LVVENPEAVLPQRTETIDLDSENLEALFVDWLRELIYRIETEHMLWCEFNVQLLDGNRRLRAICRGEPADWTRHLPDNELKAVTYHGLRVEQMPNGWQAEVIFDI
jgi:SHS2 domain-containing protein